MEMFLTNLPLASWLASSHSVRNLSGWVEETVVVVLLEWTAAQRKKSKIMLNKMYILSLSRIHLVILFATKMLTTNYLYLQFHILKDRTPYRGDWDRHTHIALYCIAALSYVTRCCIVLSASQYITALSCCITALSCYMSLHWKALSLKGEGCQ